MKYILRKFVEARTAVDAIAKDTRTPVHDCYLDEGERPGPGPRDGFVSAVGFAPPESDRDLDDAITASKKR